MNMFRKLLHVIPFVHFWEKWKVTELIGMNYRQTRTCKRCGIIKTRLE